MNNSEDKISNVLTYDDCCVNKGMTTISTVLLLLIGLSLSLSLLLYWLPEIVFANANAQIARFLTYINSQYHFEIQYDSNWQKIEFSPGIEDNDRNIVINFLSPSEGGLDTFREYLIVEVGDIHSQQSSTYSSLSQYVLNQINDYKKSFRGFQLIESSNKTRSSVSNGYLLSSDIVYTYNDPIVGKIKVMEFYFINKDKIYFLSFKSDAMKYQTYLPIIQKVVSSFRITQ